MTIVSLTLLQQRSREYMGRPLSVWTARLTSKLHQLNGLSIGVVGTPRIQRRCSFSASIRMDLHNTKRLIMDKTLTANKRPTYRLRVRPYLMVKAVFWLAGSALSFLVRRVSQVNHP